MSRSGIVALIFGIWFLETTIPFPACPIVSPIVRKLEVTLIIKINCDLQFE